LLYGRVLAFNGQLTQAAAVLADAALLFPESDEVHLELGANLVRIGSYATAAGALQHVKNVATPAEGYRLYYNLAYAQYRLADTARARESIGKARKFTRNPEEIASLDRLEQSLQRPARAAPPPRRALDEEPDPPTLRRRTETAEPAPATLQLLAVQGALENMECGTLAKLHVRVNGTLLTFLIPDPTKVAIQGADGEPVELTCGPQKTPRRLRLEYQAVNPVPGITGLVRSLEFQ
jgi:tetratricopeptide (TPR) repeat protein